MCVQAIPTTEAATVKPEKPASCTVLVSPIKVLDLPSCTTESDTRHSVAQQNDVSRVCIEPHTDQQKLKSGNGNRKHRKKESISF